MHIPTESRGVDKAPHQQIHERRDDQRLNLAGPIVRSVEGQSRVVGYK